MEEVGRRGGVGEREREKKEKRRDESRRSGRNGEREVKKRERKEGWEGGVGRMERQKRGKKREGENRRDGEREAWKGKPRKVNYLCSFHHSSGFHPQEPDTSLPNFLSQL